MFEQIWAGPLFSIRRAIFTYSLAFLMFINDMYLIHVLDIDTPEELLIQTLIHGTGAYLGFTCVALVNRPTEIPN